MYGKKLISAKLALVIAFAITLSMANFGIILADPLDKNLMFNVVKTHPGEALSAKTVDIDLDGHYDIIYSGSFNNELHIMYGLADGEFEKPIDYSIPASFFESGYLNNDNLPDLVANYSDKIMMLLNNGDRTFTINTIPHPWLTLPGIAVGHFNDDSFLDIIAPFDGNYGAAIIFGDGTGGYTSIKNLPFSTFTIYVSDFNNDYIDDIISLVSGGGGTIYLNDGSASFQATASFALGEATLSFAIADPFADFNRDGNADFAFITPTSGAEKSFPSRIFVGYGDGNGGLLNSDFYWVNETAYSLAIADVNRDNLLDLIAANSTMNTLEIFVGDIEGGFQTPEMIDLNLNTNDITHPLAVADINRDGNPDLITGVNYSVDSIIAVINALPVEAVLSRTMMSTGYSNVDFSIVNPAGNEISRLYRTVAGSAFETRDVNNDNSLDKCAVDYNVQYGNYKFEFNSKPNLTPGGNFSADIDIGGTRYYLFKDHPVPAGGGTGKADGAIVFDFPYYETSPVRPECGRKASSTPLLDWGGLDIANPAVTNYHVQVDEYYDFRSPVVDIENLTEPTYQTDTPLDIDKVYYWRVRASDGGSWTDFSPTFSVYIVPFICGDANGDDQFGLTDILELIEFKFNAGPAPQNPEAADVDNDGFINILDIVCLIDHKFKFGPEPAC